MIDLNTLLLLQVPGTSETPLWILQASCYVDEIPKESAHICWQYPPPVRLQSSNHGQATPIFCDCSLTTFSHSRQYYALKKLFIHSLTTRDLPGDAPVLEAEGTYKKSCT